MEGVFQARLEATAPWGLHREGGHTDEASSPVRLAHFGILTRGNCWLTVGGIRDAVPLSGGDCFLLAPGSCYALRDNPRSKARSFCEVAPRHGCHLIEYGGGGAPTTIVSGWFQFDPASANALSRLLPPLILVREDKAQSLALHTTLMMLAKETSNPAPGSDLVIKRLVDVLFIQCMREHFGTQTERCHSGLLHAIFDPQIGRALNVMHERLQEPWTVELLAEACGMSRSAFALRFRQLVGETPLEYLTSWRVQKARALLRARDSHLSEVAKRVGYDSDAAFSRAFKRLIGVAPGKYGRAARSTAD